MCTTKAEPQPVLKQITTPDAYTFADVLRHSCILLNPIQLTRAVKYTKYVCQASEWDIMSASEQTNSGSERVSQNLGWGSERGARVRYRRGKRLRDERKMAASQIDSSHSSSRKSVRDTTMRQWNAGQRWHAPFAFHPSNHRQPMVSSGSPPREPRTLYSSSSLSEHVMEELNVRPIGWHGFSFTDAPERSWCSAVDTCDSQMNTRTLDARGSDVRWTAEGGAYQLPAHQSPSTTLCRLQNTSFPEVPWQQQNIIIWTRGNARAE